MLEKVKLSMGITSDAFDSDITDMINACKADLKLSGVMKTWNNDPLVLQAVKFYCKAHFRSDDKSERYQKAYYNLKCAMSLAGEYNG